MPDVDTMDDFDDELTSQGSNQHIDEGSVSILSVEQIKGMKTTEKQFVPHYKKKISYNSNAFKRTLNDHHSKKTETEMTEKKLTTEVIEEVSNQNDESVIVGIRSTIDGQSIVSETTQKESLASILSSNKKEEETHDDLMNEL